MGKKRTTLPVPEHLSSATEEATFPMVAATLQVCEPLSYPYDCSLSLIVTRCNRQLILVSPNPILQGSILHAIQYQYQYPIRREHVSCLASHMSHVTCCMLSTSYTYIMYIVYYILYIIYHVTCHIEIVLRHAHPSCGKQHCYCSVCVISSARDTYKRITGHRSLVTNHPWRTEKRRHVTHWLP